MSPKHSVPIWATGRRKTSVASVRLVNGGQGKVFINSKSVEDYFRGEERRQMAVLSPLRVIEESKKFDFILKIVGGGPTGQAEAARHAISRVLVKVDEKNRKPLRAEGFLTRDARMVERKKSGQPKARKRFQYSKR
ncbi:MAG: 30S ribosomal protein S9 [Elusimicrobiota bacterium]